MIPSKLMLITLPLLTLAACAESDGERAQSSKGGGPLNRVVLDAPTPPPVDREEPAIEGPGGLAASDVTSKTGADTLRADLANERRAIELSHRDKFAAVKEATKNLVPAKVQFGFSDLTTSTGPSTVQLVVTNRGYALGPDALKLLATRARLVTWPERQAVAASVTVQDVNERGDGDPQAHVMIQPSADLGDRWYAIWSDALPSGYGWSEHSDALQVGQARVARFHPQERVVVSGIRVCGDSEVTLDFSERIQLKRPPQISIAADAKATGCSLVNPSGESALTLTYSCTGLAGARSLGVSIGSETLSLSGRAVGNRLHQLAADRLLARGDGCVRYQPPDPTD
jgi:hypothetical protein